MIPEKNWYLILELEFEPPECSPALIERRIDEKRSHWSKQSTNPDKNVAVRSKALVEQVPVIKKEMLGTKDDDREKRGALAKEALEYVKANVDLALELHRTTGINDKILKTLAQSSELSEDIILKRAGKFGIKASADLKSFYDKYLGYNADGDENDADYTNSVPHLKNAYHVDSLYGFLYYNESNIAPQARSFPIRKLQEKIKQRKDDVHIMPDNQQKASGRILNKICENIFKDENSKNNYDKYLIFSKLKKILDGMEPLIVNGQIPASTASDIVKKIHSVIDNIGEAEILFNYHCSEHNIRVLQTAPTGTAGAAAPSPPTAPQVDPKAKLFDDIRILAKNTKSLTWGEYTDFVADLTIINGGDRLDAEKSVRSVCFMNGITIQTSNAKNMSPSRLLILIFSLVFLLLLFIFSFVGRHGIDSSETMNFYSRQIAEIENDFIIEDSVLPTTPISSERKSLLSKRIAGLQQRCDSVGSSLDRLKGIKQKDKNVLLDQLGVVKRNIADLKKRIEALKIVSNTSSPRGKTAKGASVPATPPLEFGRAGKSNLRPGEQQDMWFKNNTGHPIIVGGEVRTTDANQWTKFQMTLAPGQRRTLATPAFRNKIIEYRNISHVRE